MSRWGTKAQCQKCKTTAFYLHARVAEVYNDQRGKCPNCGNPFRLIEQGKTPIQAAEAKRAQESTRVDSTPAPGELTAENYQRCTLTPEEERDALRILKSALPGGVQL